MTPCRFTFDDSPEFEGFSHGSTWNGFDNVAVTASEREKIAAYFRDSSIEGGEVATQEVADLMAIEPMAIADTPLPLTLTLYSLGWGYATQIVRPDAPSYILPAGAEALVALRFAATLQSWLTRAQWHEMCERNSVERDPKICHSHDYCDANMAMAHAIESLTGRTPDVEDEAINKLWNAAWDLAMPILGRRSPPRDIAQWATHKDH